MIGYLDADRELWLMRHRVVVGACFDSSFFASGCKDVDTRVFD